MAKNPVCPIYYNDLLQSTITWTDEEFGAYLRLLFYQWDKGSIPEDKGRIKKIAESAGRNWKLLASKFQKSDPGLQNPVMEIHRQTRKKFIEKQINNVRNRYQTSTKLSTNYPTKKLPLEDENEKEEKGGMGEKEVKLWNSEKNSFLNSDEWTMKFCIDKKISKDQLLKKMKIFISDIELKEDWKDVKELKRHFTNWFNLQRNKPEIQESRSAPLKNASQV